MNKVKTSLSYIVLVLLAIVIIASCLFLGLNNSQNIINTNDIEVSDVAISSCDSTPTAVGKVKNKITGDYVTYGNNTYTTNGNTVNGITYKLVKIGSYTKLTEFLSSNTSSTYGVLTADNISITTNAMTNYTISGILDGNGYTLEIKNSGSGTCTIGGYHGGLASELTGTVMNMTYKVTTAGFDYSTGTTDTARYFYIGAMIGRINGGTIKNVYVDYRNSNNYIAWINGEHRGTAGDQEIFGSAMVGASDGSSTIEACTVSINAEMKAYFYNYYVKSWGIKYYGNTWVSLGGFVGRQSTGTLNITNCSILGSYKFVVEHGGEKGNRQYSMGGVLAKQISGSTCNISHLYYGYTGIQGEPSSTTYQSDASMENAGTIAGNANGTTNIDNVYYNNTIKDNNGNRVLTWFESWTNNSGYVIKKSTGSSLSTIASSLVFAKDYGFANPTDDSANYLTKLWIKCPYSEDEFVSKIIFVNSNYNVADSNNDKMTDCYYFVDKDNSLSAGEEGTIYFRYKKRQDMNAELNDTKQLYDSRLDVTTGTDAEGNEVYCYDFIYNWTGNNIEISDSWIDYKSLFTLSSFKSGINAAEYEVIGFKYYTNNTFEAEASDTSGSQNTETIYYVELQTKKKNANDIIGVRYFETSGAAKDYALNYTSITTTIGEPERSGVLIRLVIAANKVVNGTTTSDDSLYNWDKANAYEGSGLWKFINSRYYDSTSFYGQTITQKATEYTFGENITYNAPANVYTILPAYKTIDGNGNSFTTVWGGGDSNGKYEVFGTRSGNPYTNDAKTDSNYRNDVISYVTISKNGTNLGEWYGASDFIALNYGTIKNLTFSMNSKTGTYHEYQALKGTNTSFGNVTGINMGKVEDVSFSSNNALSNQIRFDKITSQGELTVSMGSVAGINLGTITSKSQSSVTYTSTTKSFVIHTRESGYALNAYLGTVAGINLFGNISNYIISYEAVSAYAGASNVAIAGGIVGYNYGNGTFESNRITEGKIENIKVVTDASSVLYGGAAKDDKSIGSGIIDDYKININSFAVGGAVGVNDGGLLFGITIINSGKIAGGSLNALSQLSYVGGIVGVGCEINTCDKNNTIQFNSKIIVPGYIENSNIINYATITVTDYTTLTNGKYGIVAGTYANVADINKAFGGIIWYTSTNGTIYIYGQGGVLGHNPTQSATVSNITGLMGLDFVDGYKSFVAKEFMDSNSNIELLTKNGYEMIKIKYSAVPITNFVSGYVTVVDKNTGKEYAANPSGLDYSTSSLNIIAKNSSGEVLAGEAYIAIADLDAITTSNEAGRAKIWFKYTVDDITTTDVDISHGNDVDAASSKTRYLDFLNSKDDTLTGTRRYYQGASTFNLKNNINADIKPLDFVLNEKKVFNGNNKTITIKWGSGNLTNGSYYTDDTLYHNIKSKYTGSLVAVNKGQVINLNMTITGSDSYYLVSVEGDATYSLSVGIIAGYNSGYIANCTVNFVENKYAGMRAWSSRTYHLFGGITGINHNGTIDNCIVNINGEVKIDDNGSTNGWNAIGGVAGTTDGGFIYGTKVNITSTGKLIGYAYNACFVGGLVGFMMTNKGSNINDNADNFGGISTNPTIIECSQVINAGTITATHNQSSTALGIGVIAGEIFNSSSTTTNNDSFKNVYAISRYNAVNYGNSSAGLTIVGFNKWATPQTPIELKGITFISLKDVVGNNSVGDLVSSISTVNGNNITASNNKSYAMPNNVTFNLSNSSVIFGDNNSGTEFKMVEVNDIERTENCSINASNAVGAQTTTANYSFTFTPDSTSGLAKVIVPIYYTVQFTETEISYKTANTALNSPILNFLGGFGNLPIYLGAKKGVLQNNITIDKNGTGGRKLAQGKIFDGGGHIITAYMSQGNNETLQYEGYGSDNAAGVKTTPGGTNYVSYEYNNSSYKAGGELVAINYGTMRNFTLSLESYYKFRRYQCINADSAYGMVCGINAGTITNVVVDHTRDYHLVTNANTKVFVGEVAGMNFGTISNTKVSLTAELSIKGSATNVVVGGIAGANINGSITYCELTSSEAYRYAKEYTTEEVVIENKYYLGILSVDSGIAYAVIGGLIGINSNATAKYLIIDSIEKSEFISLATEITYFAAGIAVSDNTKNDAVGKNYTGVPLTVYPSVDGDNAKVGYIYLNFESQLRYKSTTNYIGVAFAKAAQYASTTYGNTQGAVYQGIFISPNFVEDVLQYVISADGAIALTDGSKITDYDESGNPVYSTVPSYISISSGFSVMGYCDNFNIATGVGKNIRTGARIDANEKINCTWGADGKLVIAPKNNEEVIRINTVSITNIDSDKQTTAYSYTNANKVKGQLTVSANNNDEFIGNFNQTTTHEVYLDILAISNLKRKDSYSVSQSSLGEYTIYVEYFQPIVTISNVFQLAQFMFYDPSATAANVQNWFYETFINGKTSNGVSYATMMGVTNSNMATSKDAVFYDSDVQSTFWQAKRAKLNNDIVLDKFVYNNVEYTVDLGWNHQRYFTFAKNKELDGNGHKITIVVEDFDTVTKGSLPSTSQFYVSGSGEFASETAVSETNTPAQSRKMFLAGGFIGLQRGTLKNINFVYREGSEFTIANINKNNNTLSRLQMDNCLFVGVVSGYQTGTTDSCTLTLEKDTQVFISKYADEVKDEPYYSNSFMGGYAGFIANGAVISNSKLTMLDNATLGMNIRGLNKTGTIFSGGGSGQHWGQLKGGVGGFAGMSGDNSTIFNATIDGSSSSKMFAITETYASDNLNAVNSTDYSEQYPDFENIHVVAGGIVGILTEHGAYNAYSNVGAGNIDGVIYNWKGVTYSTIMHGKDGVGAQHRTKVDYIIDGGNCVGVANGKEDNIKNLYYTFDISNFLPSKTGAVNWVDSSGNSISDTSSYTSGVVYSGDNTNSVVINVKYNGNAKAKVFNLRRDKNNNNLINNVYIFQYARPQAVGTSFNNPSGNGDRVSQQTYGENEQLNSQIKVVHVYEHNDPDNTEENDGISMAKYDQAGADPGNGVSQSNKDIIYSNAKITTPIVTSGVGYYEKTDFTDMLSWKTTSKGSNIMVKFTASNSDPSQIIWSVYMTNVTADTNGNKIDANGTITKTPMYATVKSLDDAQSNKEFKVELLRGQGSNMSIYYNYGKALTLKPDENNFREISTHTYMSDKPLMYNKIDDASSVAMKVYDIAGTSQDSLDDDIATMIQDSTEESGTGAIVRTIKRASGMPSLNEDSWTEISKIELIDPGQYKVDYDIKGSAINYNAFVYETKRSIIFPQEEQNKTGANQTIDTYTIYIAIVPIRLKISSITKVYDGNYELFPEDNYSSITATIDADGIYNPATYNCTQSNDTINITATKGGKSEVINLSLSGQFTSPNVAGENSVKIAMNSTPLYFLDLNRNESGEAIEVTSGIYSVSSTKAYAYLFSGSNVCSPYERCSKTNNNSVIEDKSYLILKHNDPLPWGGGNYEIQIKKKILIDPTTVLVFYNNATQYGTDLNVTEEHLKELVDIQTFANMGLISESDVQSFSYSAEMPSSKDVTSAEGVYYNIIITAPANSNYKFKIGDQSPTNSVTISTAKYIIYPKLITATSARKTYDGTNTVTNIVFSNGVTINPIVTYKTPNYDSTGKTLVFEVEEYTFTYYKDSNNSTVTLYQLKENGSVKSGNNYSGNYCINEDAGTYLSNKLEIKNNNFIIDKFEITTSTTDLIWTSLVGDSYIYNPTQSYTKDNLRGTVSIKNVTSPKTIDGNITYKLYQNNDSKDTISAEIIIKDSEGKIISSAQNAGTFTITVTFSGTNYTSTPITIGSFEITKQIVNAKQVTITMDPYSNIYGNTGFKSPTTLGNSYITIVDNFNSGITVSNNLKVSSVVYGANKTNITANNGEYIGGYSVWATALTGNVTGTNNINNYDISQIMTLDKHFINDGDETYFILPRQLTILNVLKTFDEKNSATNALYAVDNLASGDSINAMNATYTGGVDVGTGITVTFTFDSTRTILGKDYNVVLKNYCLEKDSYNVGTIIPKTITINNIYKVFDNTPDVNYSTSEANYSTSTVLVKDGSSSLSLKPDGKYSNKNVGECDFKPATEPFTYKTVSGNALGAETTVYRIKQSNTETNYMVATGNSDIKGIAYITPKAITIISVHKEYDENTSFTGATFKISGFLGDITEATAFNGLYKDPNVKYDGTNYNDIQLELTPTQVVLGETRTTVYSIKSGDNINYTIDKASGNSVDIEGVGVIIPAVATISEIHKEYNSKNTFSTDFAEDAKDYAIVSYLDNVGINTRTQHFVISGTLSGKDAGSNYTATIDTVTFSFGGVTYNWLYTASDASNIANNYCIASTTINTIGEIYQYNIKLDPDIEGTADGYLTDFRFYNSKDSKHWWYVNQTGTGPEYRSSVSYSADNFYAAFKLGDDEGTIEKGVLKIEGKEIKVELTIGSKKFEVTDAGTYESILLTINTSSLTNYTFTGNATFSFRIKRQTVKAEKISIYGVTGYSRDYDGTADVGNYKTTYGEFKGDLQDVDGNLVDITGYLSKDKVRIKTSTLSGANVRTYSIESQYYFNTIEVGDNYTVSSGYTYAIYSTNTAPSFKIDKKDINLSGTYIKDFDGSNLIEIDSGIMNEKLLISLDFAGQGYLAGVYTGTPTASIKSVDSSLNASNKNLSVVDNYNLVGNPTITLTINKVNNLVIERQVKNAGSGTFQIAIALSKLVSLDYLTKVSQIDGTEISNALSYISDNKTGSQEAYNKLKQAISDSFMLKVNDTPNYAHDLEVGQIESINITKQKITLEDGREIELQTLEVIYNGYSVLDNETLTDRYEIYMVGCVDNKGTIEVSSALANATTNVSISSSELENGQYNGAINSTGTAISSAEELLAFLQGSGANGYLTNNIYNFNATTLDGKTNTVAGITFASGRVLDGNGYVIQLNNGFNETTNYAGLFVVENSGTIKNVVFKIGTTQTTTKTQAGLVVGNNAGTIENVLVSIESEIADRGTSYIAGIAYNNSGSITLTTVAVNANVNDLVGFVHTNTGTMNYVSSRVKKGVTLSDSNLIAYTAGTIAYASVDNSANTLYNSGTITKLYGQNDTALSPLVNKYSDNGYVDYYFTSSNKYKTGDTLHNNENGTELNMTHYYGTASVNTQIAIEVIAPLNRFIWEAFDAIAYKDGVVSKGVQINRAVGLFALTDDLVSENSKLTFTTKVKVENVDKYASIFNPVFGAKTETVISQGTHDNIYEYTGSQITVDYTVGGEKMSITGTEVGVYRTLTKEAGGSAVIGDSYDTQNQEAHVVEGGSGTTTATVELIIVPKVLSQGTLTNTKVYDRTSIAETLVDSDNKSGNDSYITGTFTSDGITSTINVATGLTVNYNMLTRKVAAVLNDGVYTFVTKKVTDISGTYVFENINVDGVPFTSNTDISKLNKETLAKAYAKLIDYKDLTAAEKGTYVSVDVYDLIITHTTDENTHAVSYNSSQVYYAVSLFNLDGTLNKNYQYMSSTLLNVTSIKATETVKAVASVGNGSITARELQATYDANDLNKSYRDLVYNESNVAKLTIKSNITKIFIEYKDVSDSNSIKEGYDYAAEDIITKIGYKDAEGNIIAFVLPMSISQEQIRNLINEINTAAMDNVEVEISEIIETYKQIEISSNNGKVTGSDNYNVNVSKDYLTLRYFRSEVREDGTVWFKIESLEDIKAIGKEESGSDYTTLNYFVTKDINAKSAVLKQINITFEGILDGNGKTISNFVLIGETSTGIFNTLGVNAQVINLTFADVLIYTTGSGASTIDVVADTNNGTIDNIQVEGSFVSNGTVTVNGITNTNNKTVTNSVYVLQTGKNTGITFTGTTNNEVVILRDFGTTSFSVYINKEVSAISNVSGSVTQLIKNHVLDKLQLAVSDSGVVTISSFRQYWAFINICPWLTPSTNIYSVGMRN